MMRGFLGLRRKWVVISRSRQRVEDLVCKATSLHWLESGWFGIWLGERYHFALGNFLPSFNHIIDMIKSTWGVY